MITDGEIIKKARACAFNIIDGDPNLVNYKEVKKRLNIDYKDKFELVKLD